MKLKTPLNSKVISWTLFDFGNSSFATIVAALVYAVYFKSVVAENDPAADLWWALGINISMIIVAFLSPVLGAAADKFHNKKTFLLFFTVLCVISTALLYTVREGMVMWGIILFIFANIGFQGGLGFYDAFLKEITLPELYNRVSSLGYAVGYAGSLFSLGVVFMLKDTPELTFPACSLIFIVFSLPLFIKIKEHRSAVSKDNVSIFKAGFERIKDTIGNINKYASIRKFLFAYFLFIDGVATVIFFSANFAQTTLGFTLEDLILFFIIVQVTALLGSFILGFAADKTSTKGMLIFSILSWAVVTLAIFFVESKSQFYIVGSFAGIFLGSTQALSRSLFGKLIPDEKKAEFFGFYSLFEKTSSVLGPLAFGGISYLTGSQRLAVLSLLLFFISGYLLLRKVETGNDNKSSVTTD